MLPNEELLWETEEGHKHAQRVIHTRPRRTRKIQYFIIKGRAGFKEG